jgi:hypothetical protein
MRRREHGNAAERIASAGIRADIEPGGAGNRHVDLIEDRVGGDGMRCPVRAGGRVRQADRDALVGGNLLLAIAVDDDQLLRRAAALPLEKVLSFATVAMTSPLRSSMITVERTVRFGSAHPSKIW